jgi:hypothetical protein
MFVGKLISLRGENSLTKKLLDCGARGQSHVVSSKKIYIFDELRIMTIHIECRHDTYLYIFMMVG